MPKEPSLKLRSGDHSISHPKAELFFVGTGKMAYLWAGWKGGCLGTKSGPKTLKRFLLAALKQLESDKECST